MKNRGLQTKLGHVGDLGFFCGKSADNASAAVFSWGGHIVDLSDTGDGGDSWKLLVLVV